MSHQERQRYASLVRRVIRSGKASKADIDRLLSLLVVVERDHYDANDAYEAHRIYARLSRGLILEGGGELGPPPNED